MSIILLSFIKGTGPFLKPLCACTVVKTPRLIFNLLFKGKESCPKLSGPGMAAQKRQWPRYCCLPNFLNCNQWYGLLLKRKEWVCMNWSPWSLHYCHLAEMALSASSHPDLMVKSLSLCSVCSGLRRGQNNASRWPWELLWNLPWYDIHNNISFFSQVSDVFNYLECIQLSGMLLWCLIDALFFKKLKMWLMMS